MSNFVWRCLITTFLACCLWGCENVQIAEDLNQQEAHEIINLLSHAGITSESVKSRSGGSSSSYAVSVSQSDYLASIELLGQSALPRQREKGFAELVEGQGLIPNSREIESLRVDYAIAKELEEALANKAGIFAVKAVVRLHFGTKEDGRPKVALVVRHKPEANIKKSELIALVQSLVPGAIEEDIKIDLSLAEGRQNNFTRYGIKSSTGGLIAVPLVPFLFWHLPGDEHYALAVTTLGLLAAAFVLGILLGYYYAFYASFRRAQSGESRSSRMAGNVDQFSVKNLPDR